MLAGLRPYATDADRVVFVFTGQGGQWPGMAADLYASSPAFAAEFDACSAVFAEQVDFSLLAVLHAEPGAPGLNWIEILQPILFAVGVTPTAVVGKSQREVETAYVAGMLSLADAATMIAVRS